MKKLIARLAQNWPGGTLCALCCVLVGLGLWAWPGSEEWVYLSYDLPTVWRPDLPANNVVLLQLDESSNREMSQTYQKWDRGLHARLLERLRLDQCPLVVFDMFFSEQTSLGADEDFAKAIHDHGKVVLGADRGPLRVPGLVGEQTIRPIFSENNHLFCTTNWGIAKADRGTGSLIRRHYQGTDDDPSLPWAAAALMDAPVTHNPAVRMTERWLRYYGSKNWVTEMSYYLATNQAPGFFRDKVVFIGGKPDMLHVREETDVSPTPYSRFGGVEAAGIELVATSYLNLVRGDWLTRWSKTGEVLALIICGLLCGYGFGLLRPLASLGLAAGVIAAITALALVLFYRGQVWFCWSVLAGAQAPFAWLWGVVAFAQKSRQPAVESDIVTRTEPARAHIPVQGGSEVADLAFALEPETRHGSATPSDLPPPIPNHQLLRRIGRGAYGEVWLARNDIGLYAAVKIVYRNLFPTSGPFEREFRGVEKFMPISRMHAGFVNILFVGRDEGAGHFFYIMEAGDDEQQGQRIDPATYSAKSLASTIERRGRLPVGECVEICLRLCEALEYLHQQKLIHRDIKPSNIIFVNGAPKFADIGLVTTITPGGKGVTYIGTEGYLAPEGPGEPAADVYSLGKVIYAAAMGLHQDQFPTLPTSMQNPPDTALLELCPIIAKACEVNPLKRYPSAAALRADLVKLQWRESIQ